MYRLSLVLAFATVAWGAEKNAIRNPSLASGLEGWSAKTLQGTATLALSPEGRTDKSSIVAQAPQPAEALWAQAVPVQPYALYRCSGWIRTQGLKSVDGWGAFLRVSGAATAQTRILAGDNPWTEVVVTFDSEEARELTIECVLGGNGRVAGTAWFDDLALEVAAAGEPAVTIDLSRDVSPINPYLYGQFIEHLGRCIYGGLWAELLEDRKFFHPVAMATPHGTMGTDSPWKRVGPEVKASIGMSTLKPYVGRWSVELAAEEGVAAPVGIRHGGLSLTADREYAGYVIAESGAGDAALQVTLQWAGGEGARRSTDIALKPAWAKHPFRFVVKADTEQGFLTLSMTKGVVRIGAVSLMPADNVNGFRADTLALVQALAAPIYRWPGGNFASAYNWWEAIGDRDRRPPIMNPAWPGIEHHDVGIDEFMTFCALAGTEPLVVVNAGLGSTRMAAALVEYANGGPATPWGKERAKNGHDKPYGVRWWGVGNEMYGSWQHGAVPIERYLDRHKAFVEAMRAVDSSIRIIGVGASGRWSRAMLAGCADAMNMLSEHFYCSTDENVLRHVRSMRDAVRRLAEEHIGACREIFGSEQPKIPVALDEWNYQWGDDHVYGDYGVPYAWRDGLGVAAALCELVRWRNVYAMANFAQTVNVIGAIKTTPRAASLETSGLALQLFRHGFGSVGVAVEGWTSPLEVAAAMTPDRRTLTVAVVNPTARWQRLRAQVHGAAFSGQGQQILLAHPDPAAGNKPGFAPGPKDRGANPAVTLETLPWFGLDLGAIPAAPYSAAVWRLLLGSPAPAMPGLAEALAKPAGETAHFMAYAKGAQVFGASSADGLRWQAINGGAALFDVPAFEAIDGLSVCNGPSGLVFLVERQGTVVARRCAEGKSFTAPVTLKLAGQGPRKVRDPCLVYLPEEKRFVLLASTQGENDFARIDAMTSGDLAQFSPPQVALARGNHLRGLSLLGGAKHVLFFYDDRVGTARIAYAGIPEGPYVVVSPPLGDFGTAKPQALATGAGVVLYLQREHGGHQVLRSADLRGWDEVPAADVALPDEAMTCMAIVSVPKASIEGMQ